MHGDAQYRNRTSTESFDQKEDLIKIYTVSLKKIKTAE